MRKGITFEDIKDILCLKVGETILVPAKKDSMPPIKVVIKEIYPYHCIVEKNNGKRESYTYSDIYCVLCDRYKGVMK